MGREYCWHCGADVSPEANFCSECGYELRDTRPADRDTRPIDEPRPESPGEPSVGSSDETTFAAVTHVLAIFTWVVGPLIVLIAADDEFVEEHARNALNWQIMYTVYMLVSFALIIVGIGLLFLMVLPFVNIAVCVVAALKANDGEVWPYPLTPDLV
ncbi:DUF4870 domain-containing protein [Natrialbaceae archaeon A-arb3/5]